MTCLVTVYVALLRAVNVGGTGNLPMDELKAICRSAGFTAIETYIASGNVVFESDASAVRIKAELEKRGHKVEIKNPWSMNSSAGIMVDVQRGTVSAGADPRTSATALAW